jgi:hypothetical protein
MLNHQIDMQAVGDRSKLLDRAGSRRETGFLGDEEVGDRPRLLNGDR